MTPTIILLLSVSLALIFIICWLLRFSRKVFRINLAERIRVEAELVSLKKQRDGGLRATKAQLETQRVREAMASLDTPATECLRLRERVKWFETPTDQKIDQALDAAKEAK